MACILYTPICFLMLFVVGIYCSPVNIIKRSSQQATGTDCYGTECEIDLDLPTETIIDVHFPENLTQAIMTSLPNLQDTQNKTVQILEKMSVLFENMISTNEAALYRHDQQMQNLTSSVTVLVDNVANLLQSQLSVPNQRMPDLPTSTLRLSDPTTPTTTPTTALTPPPARDCQDIARRGEYRSGPYTITPEDNLGSLTVYCDIEPEGSGWTVFQRRFDGTVNFYRGWDDYEEGFGSPDGEYWMGLRQVRRLISSGYDWTLMIDLEDFNGNTAYARYSSFQIGDAASEYRLSIGSYSGTAGDSLAWHNNQRFTTKDRDNDPWSGTDNCAQFRQGAWWYNKCAFSNLNGLYLGPTGTHLTGMTWRGWKELHSLKRSEMKMRRVQ